jgi:predicted RNA-binding Zn ribbon-like protein
MPSPAEVNAEASKLDQLASTWGMSVAELIETYALDDVAPGICMNPGCTYSTEYEPDQRKGWCEECGTPTVRSALVLAGII